MDMLVDVDSMFVEVVKQLLSDEFLRDCNQLQRALFFR